MNTLNFFLITNLICWFSLITFQYKSLKQRFLIALPKGSETNSPVQFHKNSQSEIQRNFTSENSSATKQQKVPEENSEPEFSSDEEGQLEIVE